MCIVVKIGYTDGDGNRIVEPYKKEVKSLERLRKRFEKKGFTDINFVYEKHGR